MHALRSAQQAFALRILADLDEDLADGPLDAAGLATPLPGRRLLGGRAAVLFLAALYLVDHLADVRLEVELLAFERLVGRHRWLLLQNPTPCRPRVAVGSRASRVAGTRGP